MSRRRAKDAGFSPTLSRTICCHSMRATGITTYLENGGTVENAQAIAAHESPHTTKLYDRRSADTFPTKKIVKGLSVGHIGFDDGQR